MACLARLDEAVHDVEVLLNGFDGLAVAAPQVLLRQHLATAPGLGIAYVFLLTLNRVNMLSVRVALAG